MTKISLPISHLFDDEKNIKMLQGYYDCLETRPRSIKSSLEKQDIFHADNIQPIHELSDQDFNFLKEVKEKKGLQAVSFHCASRCKNPDQKDGVFQIGNSSTVYSRNDMILNCKKNIQNIRKILGKNISLLIENNNFFPTEAYDIVVDPMFLNEIVETNDIEFLFDSAHAKVSAHNLGIDYIDYRDNLPLNRMTQIQFCSPDIPSKGSSDIARDIHELPSQADIDEVKMLIEKYNVKYIIPEYYKDVNKLLTLLKTLRTYLQ